MVARTPKCQRNRCRSTVDEGNGIIHRIGNRDYRICVRCHDQFYDVMEKKGNEEARLWLTGKSKRGGTRVKKA